MAVDTRDHAASTGSSVSVFLDPSGRRWRAARWLTWAAAALVLVLLVLTVPRVYAAPLLQGRDPGPVLSKEQAGEHAPVIGSGPLERVLRVERRSGKVSGIEPFTGEHIVDLDARTARSIGRAPYVIQRHGYSESAKKTISLSFDDGPDGQVTPGLLDVLSKEKVPATFYVVGRFVVQHPEIVQRMNREGHAIGIHTLTHPDISTEPDWREQIELVATDRLLRDVTGIQTTFWRMPFTSNMVRDEQHTIDGLLRGQRLGYTHASYDFDTNDWQYDAREDATSRDIPLPDLSGDKNITVLLHDGGGPNRMRSVEYVQRLITEAKAKGYTFHSMPQVSAEIAAGNTPTEANVWDKVASMTALAMFSWPTILLRGLFYLALFMVAFVGFGSVALAFRRRRRRDATRWPSPHEAGLRVSVALAAYNEEPVIERTLQSILASNYPVDEVIVVDDGSRDGTAAAVLGVAAHDARVRLISKANGGKAAALNDALQACTADVVVTLDADTLMGKDTIGNLVRHFARDELSGDGRLGGVAGLVKVGNRKTNLLTRWQALEYLTQIGVDRSAQDSLGAIMIIPGACAAWRREAILDAGGYSEDTLAEDCDLALTLHRCGWRVTQDDEATAYTEAPETVDDLLAQRTRWTFGTMQATWKHRRMFFRRRYGALGMFFLPAYAMTIVLPLVFLPFLAVVTVMAAQQEGVWMVAKYVLLFLGLHLAIAAAGIVLVREQWKHLIMVPIYRLVYEPLRAYLLYTSVLAALKGVKMGWNKLVRKGSVDLSTAWGDEEAPAPATHWHHEVPGYEPERPAARSDRELVGAGDRA